MVLFSTLMGGPESVSLFKWRPACKTHEDEDLQRLVEGAEDAEGRVAWGQIKVVSHF